MPLQPSTLKRAVHEAKRQALIEHVRANPGITLAELNELARSLGGLAQEITVGDLLGKPGRRPRVRGTPSRSKASAALSLRGKGAREAYDAAVLKAVQAARGPIAAKDLRNLVGGNPGQLRASLGRWIGARKISRTGETRNTRYSAR